MSWKAFGDWGTSNLRLYRIEQSGTVSATTQGPGIGSLTQGAHAALRDALDTLAGGAMAADPPSEIRLCGMAGSRTGLAEAPYALCPADAEQWAREAIPLTFDGIALRIAAGLACDDLPDVMRGEEAQIFGAIAMSPDRGAGRSVHVLPGTHSKWAVVEDGRITGFRTFLSGELFALLQSRSTLLALGETGTPDEEDAGFAAGLDRANGGDGLAAALFATRSLQLRAGRSRRWATGFLSGLIIGDEVQAMRRLAGLPQSVSLIGAPALSARYVQALGAAGVAVQCLDGAACALKGLELLDVVC